MPSQLMGALTSRKRRGGDVMGRGVYPEVGSGSFGGSREGCSWKWSGPPGRHSPFPVDHVPYPGTPLLYCFIDIMSKYKIMQNTVNLGPQVVTTDVDDYLSEFRECYREGFTLRQFIKVPSIKATITMQDWSDRQPYQAVFAKPDVPEWSDGRSWKLVIAKTIFSTQEVPDVPDRTTVDDSEIIRTIDKFASEGARLVGSEPIGYVRCEATENHQYKVMGVDLFFHVPLHVDPVYYTYHTLRVATTYTTVPDVTQSFLQVSCDADWMGQMSLFLNQGWKLVDICLDTTALADAFGMRRESSTIDTLWIFEKEAAHLEDTTPRYEGVIVEYLHKIKHTMDGETPCKDWRPVIAGMGVSGWELTAIIQTPILVQSSFTTFTIKVLMLFQRAIFRDHMMANEYARKCYTAQVHKTNPYSAHRFAQAQPEVYSGTSGGPSTSLPRNIRLSTGLGGSGNPGGSGLTAASGDTYYNHTLKRYVRNTNNSNSNTWKPTAAPSGNPLSPNSVDGHVNGRTSTRKPITRRMSRSASFSQEGAIDRVPPSPAISIGSVEGTRPQLHLQESTI